MYELITLSLLMRGPTHGYVIAGVINDVIGPLAKASNGRIYPLLSKLERDGLITVKEEVESEGGRVSRSFSVTPLGKQRFRQLMMDVSSPREYRDLFAFKVTAFDQIAPEDRSRLIDHYEEFALSHLRHVELQARDIRENGREYGYKAEAMKRMATVFGHLANVWREEVAWAKSLKRAPKPPFKR